MTGQIYQTDSHSRWRCYLLAACLLVFTSLVPANAEDEDGDKSEGEKITLLQRQLADQYKLLEEKLFALHEFERDNNPMRSKLLQRAYLQSQEKMTATQLAQIVKLLSDRNLRDAEDRQELVIKELESLLTLLESEDRGQRVRDDIRRYQEYLKEVERLQRMQRGIRAQTESNGNQQRLANSQEKAANRTERLAREIRRNEESTDESVEPGPAGDSESEGQNGQNGGGQPQPGQPGSQGNSKPQNNESDPKDRDQQESENKSEDSGEKPNDENEGQQNDEGDGDDQESSGNSSEGQSGQSGGQSGDSSDSSGQSSDAQQEGNPVRKRLEEAEKRMRDAQQKLEQAKRAESIEEMRAAEKEIALAKKELEEILRQLREEEVERVLAMLEARFRKMLEREIRVYESTRKLEQRPPAERNADFEIRAGKLATEQNSIATEASRALLLLREDGSSVAFPQTVEQMQEDMIQVAQRLSAAKVGTITLEIEEDIIDTLDYLIEALVKTQQDMEAMKQSGKQQQGSGMAGDMPLVDQLAEIKMMRGLQERIYKRHKRYSRLLDDPDDQIGQTDDPDLRRALIRLSERQQQLTDIARDIVSGKNQ